jgi:hypothetical protein
LVSRLRQRSDEHVCSRWLLAKFVEFLLDSVRVEYFYQCACIVVVQLEQCVEPVVVVRGGCEFSDESDQLQVVVQRYCVLGQLVYEFRFEFVVERVVVPHPSESGRCWFESVVSDWRCGV